MKARDVVDAELVLSWRQRLACWLERHGFGPDPDKVKGRPLVRFVIYRDGEAGGWIVETEAARRECWSLDRGAYPRGGMLAWHERECVGVTRPVG